LSGPLSVRLYPDNRPNHLETSELNKGIVLMYNGKELIEEGLGFGVPVIKYADKTFFPGKPAVSHTRSGSCWILKKVYTLNMVSIKKFRSTRIDDRLYSLFLKNFNLLYLNYKNINGLFNKALEVRGALNVTTEFARVEPRGTVAVTYRCQPRGIGVEADFSDLWLDGCREMLMLNEQGSSYFPKYTDSNGETLLGSQMGAWERVDADYACLQGINGQPSFGVYRKSAALLYRGYEHIPNRLSWAGLGYAISPNTVKFSYDIELLSKQDNDGR
jgi:hypothetical protein